MHQSRDRAIEPVVSRTAERDRLQQQLPDTLPQPLREVSDTAVWAAKAYPGLTLEKAQEMIDAFGF